MLRKIGRVLLAIILGIPLGLVCFPVVLLWITPMLIFTFFSTRFAARRLYRKLAKENRTLPLGDAKRRLAANDGILIVDTFTPGWGVTRLWWTPAGSIVPGEHGPKAPDSFCTEADEANYDNLLDETRGTAKLIKPLISSRSYVKRHFGEVEQASVFSGGVLLKRRAAKEKQSDPAAEA